MNGSIPGSDIAWTALAAIGLALVLVLAAGWLIDNALLPVLRPVLRPVRPWLERKHPAVGAHRLVADDEPYAAGHARPETAEGEGRALHGLNHAHNDDRCSDPPEVSCSDAGCPVHGGDWHPLDDYDTDTLAVFAEMNAEHPVPNGEPPQANLFPDEPWCPGCGFANTSSGPCEVCGTDPETGAAGQDFLDERDQSAQQPSGESGELGAQAAAHRPFSQLPAADALDALIEARRDETIVDPQLGEWIREALGFGSVDLYMDSMRRKLAEVTS
jgi:hypothetical protein